MYSVKGMEPYSNVMCVYDQGAVFTAQSIIYMGCLVRFGHVWSGLVWFGLVRVSFAAWRGADQIDP